jgi:phosphomannomutase
VTRSNLVDRARDWLANDPDPVTRAEIRGLLEARDDEALRDRFGSSLAFGTAGLRGPMGAGPNRMNRLVVRRATAALMAHLGSRATVVVGHDARANSALFALEAARVAAGAGGRALMLPEWAPTPLVAFAVRHLGTDAGIACTASHNPPGDNGYKLYLDDGAQVLPPIDSQIAAAIGASGDARIAVADEDDPRITRLGEDILDAYVHHLAGLVTRTGPRSITIVYSALHGVGTALTQRAFSAAGFPPLRLVTRQCDPDAAFPTVDLPNPEEPDALALTIAEGSRVGADLGIVHDPDADRMGVVAPWDGRWRALTGNQIGALLADHVLRRGDGPDRLVVDTVVSSQLLAAMAADHGVRHERTLTGFKWIVRPAIVHPELRFVFGYEEALGYSVDGYVRDKDGISAALFFAELAAELRAEGRTVWDRLDDIARRYGLHATATWSIRFDRDEEARAAVSAWFANLPDRIADTPVARIVDRRDGGDLPPADLVELELEDRTRLAVRPSGTEPRVKVYAEVVMPVAGGASALAEAQRSADARLERLRQDLLSGAGPGGSGATGDGP